MGEFLNTFERYEKKYLLDERQFDFLLAGMAQKVEPERYGRHTIRNLYFDTPDYRLVRSSVEKPVYKEKLRLRSYAAPDADSTVFVELKKKFKGVVYKRRAAMTYREAHAYLLRGRSPDPDSQILREIDWFKRFYPLRPAVNLSYVRQAYVGRDDAALRVTFDSDILWRSENIDLAKGVYGAPLLAPGQRLMELKTAGAIPLWLCGLLNEARAYPTSFSKYGNSYLRMLDGEKKVKEVFTCA